MRLIRLLKNDLCREVATWVGEEIISTEQAESICSRYGVDYHNLSRRSYGYQVLVGLGCLFIGLSLITFIGANWEEIPRAMRLFGLIALTVGTNLFGLIKYRREQMNIALAWFFLGCLFYGASIILIAQIYHIEEHFPDGIFWWAMGVLPVALLLESTFIMLLAVVLGFIWFFVESSLNFYPTLFPVFLTAILWHLTRDKQSNILFILLIAGFGIWTEYTFAWLISDQPGFQPGAENVALGIGLFVLFQGLSKWLAERREPKLVDYGVLLNLWTLRFILLTLFVFSFKEPWRELIKAEWHMVGLSIIISFLLSTLALLLAYWSRKSIITTGTFASLFIVGLLTVIIVEDQTYDIVFQFADNILLVVVGIWLIIRGIQNNISHYFYAGILAILVTGLLRYIDLVGDYIGASILFAILATILLFSARYWKSHKVKTEARS